MKKPMALEIKSGIVLTVLYFVVVVIVWCRLVGGPPQTLRELESLSAFLPLLALIWFVVLNWSMAKNAARQASASEDLAKLSKITQRREKARAQPWFHDTGGSGTSCTIYSYGETITNVRASGGGMEMFHRPQVRNGEFFTLTFSEDAEQTKFSLWYEDALGEEQICDCTHSVSQGISFGDPTGISA